MFNRIEVAQDLWIGDPGPGPYKGPSTSKPMQPQQIINPRPTGKKQIALRLYSVRCESPGQLKEFLLLAENNDKANSIVKDVYGYTVLSVSELSGPFKCGSVLMIRDN